MGRRNRELAKNAIERLHSIRHEVRTTPLFDQLSRLEVSRKVTDAEAVKLIERSGYVNYLANNGMHMNLISGDVLWKLKSYVDSIVADPPSERRLAEDVRGAVDELRAKESLEFVSKMSIAALKDATREKLRIGSLEQHGIKTIGDIISFQRVLQRFPGIGEKSARDILGAVQTLFQATYDEMPARLDIKKRLPEATEVLVRLIRWRNVKAIPDGSAIMEEIDRYAAITSRMRWDTSLAIVGCRFGHSISEFLEQIDSMRALAYFGRLALGRGEIVNPWEEFLARPADYYAMLDELGILSEDRERTQGDLPAELVESIRNQQLDVSLLSGSLRGYQAFAARFCLVQRKVIIGDEMGLGKTFEALAVLAHLAAGGDRFGMVVCPASVVTNWVREIGDKSRLRVHRLHGSHRAVEASNWLKMGGVAVTTYETLAWVEQEITLPKDLACLVVDEAHYIKNPDAIRSTRVRSLLSKVPRAVLMTGTPLENRLDEFRVLASYVRPELGLDGNSVTTLDFKRKVVSVYLRRNAEDVLDELPPLIEIREWLPMSREDEKVYRSAVHLGNFMQMRQSAMLARNQSTKVRRLKEIIEEAESNGRRVLVFSFFREVLKMLSDEIRQKSFGPLTGSVAATKRQELVDEFSQAPPGSVLLAQIQAGGVGLNIQSASVVVICEPQLKPTIEWQAIARAHRMGQVHTVQVHRLLTEEGVDRRITELLGEKTELFDHFARDSALAKGAPEAYDTMTESELTRQVISEERNRLFGRWSTESDR